MIFYWCGINMCVTTRLLSCVCLCNLLPFSYPFLLLFSFSFLFLFSHCKKSNCNSSTTTVTLFNSNLNFCVIWKFSAVKKCQEKKKKRRQSFQHWTSSLLSSLHSFSFSTFILSFIYILLFFHTRFLHSLVKKSCTNNNRSCHVMEWCKNEPSRIFQEIHFLLQKRISSRKRKRRSRREKEEVEWRVEKRCWSASYKWWCKETGRRAPSKWGRKTGWKKEEKEDWRDERKESSKKMYAYLIKTCRQTGFLIGGVDDGIVQSS